MEDTGNMDMTTQAAYDQMVEDKGVEVPSGLYVHAPSPLEAEHNADNFAVSHS